MAKDEMFKPMRKDPRMETYTEAWIKIEDERKQQQADHEQELRNEGFEMHNGKWMHWGDIQQENHDKEEMLFSRAGWNVLDCHRPWYAFPENCYPEGTLRTVASVLNTCYTHTSGYDFWYIEGDIKLPEGAGYERMVYEVKKGEWVVIKTEEKYPERSEDQK